MITAVIKADVDQDRERRAAAAKLLARAKRFTASEIIDEPIPLQVIEGVAWQGRTTVIAGSSGDGKSFLVHSMEAHVDAGLPWFGRRTMRGTTVHIPYEADAINVRLQAIRDVQGFRLEHVHVVQAADPISPRAFDGDEQPSIGELVIAEHLREIDRQVRVANSPDVLLVVIDTVRASMTGSEDASDNTSAYLRAAKRAVHSVVPNAAIVLLHHTGWQDGQDARKRERGSSAWRGNVDVTLYLEAADYDRDRGEAALTLHTRKARDGEKLPPLHLIRRTVEVPGRINAYGEPVTTCVIERDQRTAAARVADVERATEAAANDFDLKVLRLMAERPELTSQDALRVALNVRKILVSAAVARIVRRGWAVPSGRGRAYIITAEGREILEQQNSSQPFPIVPGTVPPLESREPGTVPTLRGTVHGNCSADAADGRTVPDGGVAHAERM